MMRNNHFVHSLVSFLTVNHDITSELLNIQIWENNFYLTECIICINIIVMSYDFLKYILNSHTYLHD